MVRLTFYDGASCIGGNKFLLESDGTAILLDFGTSFSKEALYFDEFLRPRSIMGLGDMLELGLLPPIYGMYRTDCELPDRNWWRKLAGSALYRELKPDGVLLSHAHLDHAGYLSYLDPEIPVFATLTTAVILKSYQDTSQGGLERELCYVAPRTAKDGILVAGNYKTEPYLLRRFVVTDCPVIPVQIAGYWNQSPSSRAMLPRALEQGSLSGEFQVGNLKAKVYHVDHSIPGACGYIISTPAGELVYTGDIRLHGKKGFLTRDFVKAAQSVEPLALIVECTRPETTQPVSEDEVYLRVQEELAGASQMVVADFGPRNIERLLTFWDAARAAGRQLAITTKDAYLLEALFLAGEPEVPRPIEEESMVLYLKAKSQRQMWEQMLIDAYLARCPERVISSRDVARCPGDYVLCFSYYDVTELIDIGVYGGTYIYSSSEAFNEEMQVDLDRMKNWVSRFQLKLVGDPGDFAGIGRQRGFHASGHIHGPGLIELIETINPKTVILVHGENREFIRDQLLGRVEVLLPELGESFQL